MREPTHRADSSWPRSSWFFATVISILITLTYSGYKRLMWDDEFFHFAFAGVSNPLTAFRLIREQTGEIFFGRTGVYAALDYVLLRLGGADFILLRLPSLVSILFLFWSVLFFLQAMGYPWLAGIIALFLFASQTSLMFYAGEAASYMPLAASTVGIFCYYSLPLERRHSASAAALGWIAALAGVLFHPYFLGYWVLALTFGVMIFRTINGEGLRGNFRSFLNIPLIAVSLTIGIAIGALTWLQRTAPHYLDPFVLTRDRGGLLRTFFEEHFSPTPKSPLLLLFVVILFFVTLGWSLLRGRKIGYAEAFLPPLTLIFVALLASLCLTLLSISRDYWILPRQWIGSQALVTLGLAWLIAQGTCILSRKKLILPKVGILVLSGAIVLLGLWRMSLHFQTMLWDIEVFDNYRSSHSLAPPGSDFVRPTTNSEWITLGNNNVIFGGPVWPEVASYYGYEPPNAEK